MVTPLIGGHRQWFCFGILAVLFACGAPLPIAAPVDGGDWPMWGGAPDRNMVSPEKNLATVFGGTKNENIKWTADLGTQTYGNPVISDGRVYIGTNNGHPRNPAIKGDRGVLMCFSTSDGSFLWQAVHEKLPTGDAEDWEEIGICSTPCVVDDRVYYVNNRAELVACDAEGFADGENDGPFGDEEFSSPGDADLLWVLDMRGELGVTPYQASASSPLVVDGVVFVVTGHGMDEHLGKVKNPTAPSFLAVDAAKGEVLWEDHSPGDRIFEGQWGSPAYAVVEGQPQVAFPGGDGWLYAFEPKSGKLLWKFNCKAHEKTRANGKPETKDYLVAHPVYAGFTVMIALGASPESGDDYGCLWAIDARKRGDITKTAELWRLQRKEFGRSVSGVAVDAGLVYAVEMGGLVSCIELATGVRVWRHDFFSAIWGTPLVADGKVYLRNEDGEVIVFAAGREKKILATNGLPGLSHGTVTAARGTLYLAGESQLYAIALPD